MNKQKEKEYLYIRKMDINIKDLGQEICQMVKENKLGKIRMEYLFMKENF
jgi:hypothetical protein